MKLKDRLQKNKNITDISDKIQNNKGDFEISDIFVDSKEVRKYIIDLAANKRNIILISNKSFDKLIIADYIKSQLRKTNARIISDIDSRIDDLNGRINIVPNPDIKTIVKIMEQIIYGCQSFIFGLNLGQYTNVINKLTVLTALNFKNLSTVDIKTLISAMDAVIVYISKNENNMLFISQIDEIKYNATETELVLKTLLSNEDIVKNIKPSEVEHKEETSAPPQVTYKRVEETIEEEQKEQSTEIKKEEKTTEQKEEMVSLKQVIEKEAQESTQKEKKLNKYQLLRERAKQKKI